MRLNQRLTVTYHSLFIQTQNTPRLKESIQPIQHRRTTHGERISVVGKNTICPTLQPAWWRLAYLQKFAWEISSQWPYLTASTRALSTHSNCPEDSEPLILLQRDSKLNKTSVMSVENKMCLTLNQIPAGKTYHGAKRHLWTLSNAESF